MQNIAFMGLTQAMTVLIAEHMHFLFLILKERERDEWVDKMAYDRHGKRVAAATTLKNVRYCMGKNFIVHGTIIGHSVDDLYE